MDTRKKPAKVYSFGAFELRSESYELRKYGLPVHLAPQPLRALLLLVERAGEIVTRDELKELTWGQEVVVDFEVGLNRCIGRLRTALSDNADKPLYIQTIPKVGYRFIAPIHTVGTKGSPAKIQMSASELTSSAVHTPETIQSPGDKSATAPMVPRFAPAVSAEANLARRGLLRKLAAAGLSVVLLLCVVLYLRRPDHGILPTPFTPVPLVNEVGDATNPSFSPGGEQIAFSWNGVKQDNFDIYVNIVNSTAQLRLTHDPGVDSSPVWSPDGQFIAFFRSKPEGGSAIWMVSPLGGPERKVLELNEPIAIHFDGLTWTPDSQALIYSDTPAKDRSGALFVLDWKTGMKRQLTFPPTGCTDDRPAVAPDGHALAFTRDTGRGVRSIFLLPLDGDRSAAGSPVKLSWAGFGAVSSSQPKWTPDSKEIVFQSNKTGEDQLWMAHHGREKPPELIGSLGTNINGFAISRAGALAFVRVNGEVNIWRLDVHALRNASAAVPVRAVFSRRFQANPSVSPDGSKLAFESNAKGPMEIWTANSDGSEATPLTSLRNPITGSASWSHDGSRIAFDSRVSGVPAIYVVPSAGGAPSQLTKGSSRDVIPSWSSDDQWIFFTSDRSGTLQIWRVRASGGAPEQVTRNGGFAAVASPDGRFLYYSADRRLGTSLKRLNLSNGTESTVATNIVLRAYAPTVGGVFAVTGRPYQEQCLQFYPSERGGAELIRRFDKPIAGAVALSSDGQQLYYGQVDENSSDLLFVEKFWH